LAAAFDDGVPVAVRFGLIGATTYAERRRQTRDSSGYLPAL
jgi:hypothetical protein